MDEQKDIWAILEEVTDKGWCDSKSAETLEALRKRALQYLRQLEDKQIATKRQAEKGE